MAHNRKLVLSGASLTTARLNRHSQKVGPEVMDSIEELMVSSGFLDSAPFTWVGLTLRYGVKNEEEPHYQGIDKNDGELALAIELDTHELRDADKEQLFRLFCIATLKSLIHAGKKYDLATQELEERLSVLHENTKRG